MNQNHIEGLSDFLERWNNHIGTEDAPVNNLKSLVGNINTTGSPNCFVSYISTRWDKDFADNLEAGIKGLVLFLVKRMNCITYSSCQGHPRVNSTLRFRERHVGIIPRNREEKYWLKDFLGDVSETANSLSNVKSVKVFIEIGLITSNGLSKSCVDIIFASTNQNEKKYFQELEKLYSLFLSVINEKYRKHYS